MANRSIIRNTLALDGQTISYLHSEDGSPVLLLHGTFWSRVWLPVIPELAESHEVFVPD